ncbi:hypothetical protein PybrP1_012455 [[Pythium] brassicae (nom. inval.)]|nr:hypothetical protein PybrP1_012455 [[Pythium] brassicae (nom. inval.)]
MRSWSRSGAGHRGGSGGSVLPIRNDDEAADLKYYHSKPSPPPQQRRRSGSGPRGLRRWLWLFLLANIFAVLVFIFGSVLYFPSVEPDNAVVRQALSQGDSGLRGGEQEQQAAAPSPAVLDDNALEAEHEGTARVTVDSVAEPPPAESELQAQTQESAEPQQTHLSAPDSDTDLTLEVATERRGSDDALVEHTDAVAGTTAVTTSANRVAGLIAQMKAKALRGTSPAYGDDGATTTAETQDGDARRESELKEAVQLPRNDGEQQQPQPQPDDEDGIRQNLVVWLKADKGVEVEDLDQCRSTGVGTSWTSQVAPDAFVPATSDQTRPSFISSVSDHNELPALFFACPLVNGNLKLHAYMTLFFVLSPAQIEPGAPFKAQKFFGNSPYGQFLFDAGKPGFFSNGGLRELGDAASADHLYLLAYRLLSSAVELRLNRSQWRRGVAPSQPAAAAAGERDEDAFAVRMSNNAVLTLGNVKPLCDSNAFQGRIAEVLVFDTVLTDDRVARVERYLERKWWREPFTNAAVSEEGALAASATTEPAEDLQQAAEAELLAADEPQPTEATDAVESDRSHTVALESQPLRAQGVEGAQTDAPSPTFDSEGVFEWTPPQALLAQKPSERAQQLASDWARAVRESVESIRTFSFGGNVLRAFIRGRKDELLALRQELFG